VTRLEACPSVTVDTPHPEISAELEGADHPFTCAPRATAESYFADEGR
jgi:hypothetical protein